MLIHDEMKMIKTIANKKAYDIDGSSLDINSSKIKDLYSIGENVDNFDTNDKTVAIVQDINTGSYSKLNKIETGKKLTYDDFSINIRNDYIKLRQNRSDLSKISRKNTETFKQEIINRDGNVFSKTETVKLLNKEDEMTELFDIENNPEETLAIGRIKTTIGPDPEIEYKGEDNYNFIQKKESIVYIPGKLNVDSECNFNQNVFIDENLNINGNLFLNENKAITKTKIGLMNNFLLNEDDYNNGINIKDLIKKWRLTRNIEIEKGEIFITVCSNILDLPIANYCIQHQKEYDPQSYLSLFYIIELFHQ